MAAVAVLAAAVTALLAPTAQARTVCGQESAVAVVYRVAAVHLDVEITGHFQDAAGDYQNATFTTDGVAHPSFNSRNFGDFGGCPGDPPSCIAGAPICRGDWWSSTAFQMTTDVTESGFDSGVNDASSPSSSSCQGSYQDQPKIASAWRVGLYGGEGNAGTPPRPRLAVYSYAAPLRFGTCEVDDVEVLDDIVTDAVYHTYYAPTRLSLPVLWRAGPRFALPVNAGYSGPIPVVGGQYGGDPGAETAVTVRWHGSIKFVRAYTCKPNGCAPPQEPAADSSG